MKIEGSACIGFECLTRNRIEVICGRAVGVVRAVGVGG